MNGLDLAARGLARRALQSQEALASNDGADLVGTSYGISSQQRMGERVSILEAVAPAAHGAVLAGTNDDDHADGLNALIDQLSAAGGGVIECPPRGATKLNFSAPIVPKNNVSLVGQAGHIANAPTYGAGTYGGVAMPTFKALPGCPWIIESGPDTLSQFGLVGIRFEGITGDGGGGIHIRDMLRGGIKGCVFRYFDEQAIWGEKIHISLIEDNIATNVLQNSVRSELSGALQIDQIFDSVIHRGEYNGNRIDNATGLNSGLSSANLYCAAVAIKGGSSSWLLDIVAEYGDVSYDIAAKEMIVRGCRADFSGAYGFRVRGTDCQFTGNKGYRSGGAADNTFSDFRVEAGAVRNMFVGNQSVAYSTDAARVAHVIEDVGSTLANPNHYIGTFGLNTRSSTYAFPAGANNAANVEVLQGFPKLFANGDSTPSVDNRDKFQWFNPTAVSVTMFDGGVPGQRIAVRSNTGAVVTIVHNAANIVNINCANRVLIANRDYEYLNVAGVWYEQPHQHGVIGGAQTQTGDADATLTVDGSTTRRWTAALTANRTATLSATGASKGDRLHVVRNAGGAFNLTMANGGPSAGTLATLTGAGQFATAEFDGADWFVSA
jgi:hypothetical protein